MFNSGSRLMAVAAANKISPVPIANVLALLHFDGTSGSAAIVDTRGNPLTVRSGVVLSDTTSKFGGTSGSFDGSGGHYISSTNPIPGLAFGTGDFCVEGFVNFSALGGGGITRGVFQISTSSTGLYGSFANTLALDSRTLDTLWEIYASNGQPAASSAPVIGTWYHFAVQRVSGTTKLFINGVPLISLPDTQDYTGTYLSVGGIYDTPHMMDGYIDEFRVCNVAVYPVNGFTVPTAPFPNS